MPFVIEEKVKGQDFGSVGVKHVKMLEFCWQWSQYARLVNIIQIQNSLLYAACFVTMLMQWESQCPLADNGVDRLSCVTIVMKHLTYGNLFWCSIYLINIWRQLPAKLEHFYLFDPCRTKILSFDLFFNNSKTIRQTILFLNRCNKRNLYGFWQH